MLAALPPPTDPAADQPPVSLAPSLPLAFCPSGRPFG
ncbi:hypothetical protein CFIMG_005093RA [Ceratocystis fimbriata CBS 114723]|uniref:Uncharacterized protein n=1 Tax=Ceratocystis fimbriata CBS 114723 TaxID=1035309 RepID=A0A2C5X2S3_9PEZI|nr:hypothetical protein CFIMG_005093RA [Ceratocystis fimbriata CBS 114723]